MSGSLNAPSPHTSRERLAVKDRPPLPSSDQELKRDYDVPAADPARKSTKSAKSGQASAKAAAAACTVSNFTSNTGWALVDAIKASTPECINSLFGLTGSDATYAFRESQMTYVAYGLRDNGGRYTGDNSDSTLQLVLYLRAGYYVHWYYPSTVGTYGTALQSAIRSGLDAFFANGRSSDVNDANGETLSEAVTLIDSAEENARYLYVVKRLLNGYNSSYNQYWYMLNAVNSVYTVMFRGHQVPEFATLVQSDTSIIDTLYSFANNNMALMGTDNDFLTSNAGREMSRFLQYASLKSKVRPLSKALLDRSSLTGTTARLWVGVAEMTDYYDKANCSYFGTCDLQARVKAAVLPISHTCSSTLRILAQDMTAAQLSTSCTSLANQDAYFHNIVRDNGPVANDNNTSLEVIVFNSSSDYGTYAGVMYGIDTNNGGMYLEGDPSAAGNQPRFIAYEAEWLRPTFAIWNLNHEYTHYLDGRFNMFGDFTANITTPTIWWIEGFAEYVSYSYRQEVYDIAITEAAKKTYTLRQLFDTTYNDDTTRIYRWGYLAVRYMLEKHPSDVSTFLGYYRSGNWNAARTFLTGLNYNTDWNTWLTACATGACAGSGGTNQAPTAAFTSSVSGATVTFTDGSTDSDGTIASRAWDFGDGTTSTATNPSKTYTASGTYTVRLTVTDNKGATGTVSKSVTVSTGGGTNQAPTAAFTSSVSGATVTFTDGSTDSDGTIASRAWDFGDGTTSTATNPSKTYTASGTYTVKLTVTDNKGATGTVSKSVTVSTGGGTLPTCTGSDVRTL
ncbi:collagenase, partial [Streptosporangium sp. NPDC004631]